MSTPTPVKIEGRISFGVAYFTTSTEAEIYGRIVARRGDTRNGGFYHGMACGRDPGLDYTDATLGRLYAVTTR